MEKKASLLRSDRPGIDGLTPSEEPVAHGPVQKEEGAMDGQSAARMTSPKRDPKEKEATDALVAEGVARERAERLVAAHGTDWEALKRVAWPDKAEDHDSASESETSSVISDRKASLKQHHSEGIPPYDPPGLTDDNKSE
jgi:hypothetical protein